MTVADPLPARSESLAREFGVHTTPDNVSAARGADIIVLAVKPQDVRRGCNRDRRGHRRSTAARGVGRGRHPSRGSRPLAGRTCSARAGDAEPAGPHRRGASPRCTRRRVSRRRNATRAEQILAATGETLWIEPEPLLDVVTAVSGSGPAYFFLLIEVLEDAGLAQGLSADVARRLAVVDG